MAFSQKDWYHLSKKGYRIHIVPDISYNKDTIEKEAQKIHTYLEKNDLENVIIIAHSKGGLIGKHYMQDDNTADNRVIRLIALATPFSGSYLAGRSPLVQMKELAPNQGVILKLDSQQKPNNQIVSIFPHWDNHVTHENKSYLKGAKNIKVNIPGHHRLLFDARVLKLIEQELL